MKKASNLKVIVTVSKHQRSLKKCDRKYLHQFGEAPWSSGEHRGLTIQAMVLGRGFETRLHLKTRWKDGSLGARKNNER